jgi:Icc-related predicted phosphoesterase
MEIQYASDLHLDYFPKIKSFNDFIIPSAPILVLAGDIASAWHPVYADFLYWCSHFWEHIILITGNHEYHCDKIPYTRPETDKHIRNLCLKFRNIHFLQGGSAYTIPNTNLVFIGATLYSDIDPNIHFDIISKSDFTKTFVKLSDNIYYTNPSDLVEIHAQHKQALSDAIRAVPRNYRVIVVTHYMPTEELLEPEYRKEAWRSCYASHDDHLIRPPVSLWICGHSHRSVLLEKHGALLAMNARGNKRDEIERVHDVYLRDAVVCMFG